MSFAYEASEVETEAMKAFALDHRAKCGESQATTGEFLKIMLVPCGLGVHLSVQCLKCREEKNCTEYEAW